VKTKKRYVKVLECGATLDQRIKTVLAFVRGGEP